MSKKTREALGFSLTILGYCLFFVGLFGHRLELPETFPVGLIGLIGIVGIAVGELTQYYRKGLSTKTKRMLLATAGYFAALVIADLLLPSDIEINTFILVLLAAVIIGFWWLLLASLNRMQREAEAIDQVEEVDPKDD